MMRVITLLIVLLTSALSHAATTDIPVEDRTVVQRCVIDGPSARMIAVGFPGGFNYAFDAQNCASVYAWNGGFVDFSGETLGRGGRKCTILGTKQPLGTATVPLRFGDPERLPKSLAFKGYQRNHNSGTPTFLFELNGSLVEQSLESSAPGTVRVNLSFAEPNAGDKFYHLDSSEHANIELSKGLHWHSQGVVAIPSGIETATLTLTLKPIEKAFVRENEQLSGTKLYNYYCRACHSDDGTKLIGPSFKGLWGRAQELTRNGTTEPVTADAAYIRESITHPQAAIVKGYETVPMPSFATILSDQDIETLIGFLENPE